MSVSSQQKSKKLLIKWARGVDRARGHGKVVGMSGLYPQPVSTNAPRTIDHSSKVRGAFYAPPSTPAARRTANEPCGAVGDLTFIVPPRFPCRARGGLRCAATSTPLWPRGNEGVSSHLAPPYGLAPMRGFYAASDSLRGIKPARGFLRFAPHRHALSRTAPLRHTPQRLLAK